MIKILMTDDEEKFCKMVKTNLELTGRFEVRYESKTEKFFEVYREFKPNVIILDILMPDKWGYDLAGQIKKEKGGTTTPYFFVTALAQKGQKELYGGLIDDRPFYPKPLYAKPISTKDLIKAVEDSLLRRELFVKSQVCQACKQPMTGVNESELDLTDPAAPKLVHQRCGVMDRE